MLDWIKKILNAPKRASVSVAESREFESVDPLMGKENGSVAYKDQGDRQLGEGQFVEAEQSFRKAVELDTGYAKAHCNLGFALKEQGRNEEAEKSLMRALELDPKIADAHYMLGGLYRQLGSFGLAEERFRSAIELEPEFEFSYRDLCDLLVQQGRLKESKQVALLGIADNPQSIELHFYLGNLYYQENQLEAAAESLKNVLSLQAEHALAQSNLGLVLLKLDKLDPAIDVLKKLLEHNPKMENAYVNLSSALYRQDKFAEALEVCQNGLSGGCESAQLHYNFGLVLSAQEKRDKAIEHYRKALIMDARYADAHINLAAILEESGQLENAIIHYNKAIEINPDLVIAHNNLGTTLKELDRFDEAERSYYRALDINPEFPETRANLSVLFLSLGRYAEAWSYYESRYAVEITESHSKIPDLPYKQWQGEPLEGRSLVIWPEQGFGDYIQFVRYATLLKAKGVSRLTVFCSPVLEDLLRSMAGVDYVVTELSLVPTHDYWCFALSLPFHFATTLDTIPAELPYLRVPSIRMDKWRSRLPSQGVRVGLVWKGSPVHRNDANRSLLGLETLAPLWSVPGVSFVSLQKWQGENETELLSVVQPLVALGGEIQDFADTAAIVEQLDLVICVDTAIAHVAGALGKRCWVLLPAFRTDWRWLFERADSPWYPNTIRLFRQKKNGDWSDVIANLVSALAEVCAEQ